MRLRRFTGLDTAAALRRVKEALGPDAVILQTRAHAEGGVEITAAVDAELVTPPLAATPSELADLTRELRDLGVHVRALDRAVRPSAPAFATLGAEAWALAERLALQGMAVDLAAPIAASFETARQAGAASGTALEQSLARHLAPPARAEPRVTAFVGPTGAGKTTTIAKLAARHVRDGGRRVGLVMTDVARVGAREQLGAYARLLDVPMQVARDGSELSEALASFSDRDTVYIDTAGLGGDSGDVVALERLLAAADQPVARTAVVSAGASEAALRGAWRQLGAIAPESCVVTKVDEGASLGTACSWVLERRLALAWLGVGQRVPEDLSSPSGSVLARWLVAA
jgi:flagellar biosynthesis protein FlhF